MMTDSNFLENWKFSHGLLFLYKFFIAVTAFDPLSRFDALLKTLQGYTKIPGRQDFYIFIDYEHREDKEVLKELLEPNLDDCSIEIFVADPQYIGFSLTCSFIKFINLIIINLPI